MLGGGTSSGRVAGVHRKPARVRRGAGRRVRAASGERNDGEDAGRACEDDAEEHAREDPRRGGRRREPQPELGVASAQPNVIEESVKSRTVGMPGASGTSLAVVNVV